MRPEILFPLFRPATALPGVGPRNAKLIEKIAGGLVVDLCWHLPIGIIDRRFAPKVGEAPIGSIATLTVQVDQHNPPPTKRLPYKVRCFDETGFISLTFFHAREDYLMRALPPGETRVVSGRVEEYGGERQMTHPDHISTLKEIEQLQAVEPVYPLTAGLTSKPLHKAIRAAVADAPDLPEWLDPAYLVRQKWPVWGEALKSAHGPEDEADLDPATPARQRLAFDELLANQLALSLIRADMRRRPGRPISGDGHLRRAVVEALPYSLTDGQVAAGREIEADMASEARMIRLLQGDVGSGKTVVAMLAMLTAVESGAQAAIMAPTALLARQHASTLAPMADSAGVEIALLTGNEKGPPREELLQRLRRGGIGILVGTHAVFQESVEFYDLALAVIDEQHRFGVHQRLALAAKSAAQDRRKPGELDILLMTATPIPRTLALTAYGDMEISRLTEKPPGRQPIVTRVLPLDRLHEVVASLERLRAGGGRAYWVCPLVGESEKVDLAAAEDRFVALRGQLGDRVGLVHGQMPSKQRDRAMAAFTSGDIDVLVATTVIEVGVDVPAATVMVIEHAERFGLAQLHQLRGRVGRGETASSCLLLYAPPLGETARARLNIMRETDDGFLIAEEDLRLRGSGEVLGTRQSGLPQFRVADLAAHGDLLAVAHDDARLILVRDPDLVSDRGKALRVLLYLFARDSAVRYLRSG
jgi:ATP-dependent DNA helicase RecG